jgi:hypothetical protein
MRFQNCLLTSKYPGTSRSMVVQCSAVTHDVSTESLWNIIVAHVHLFNIPLQRCMRTSTACFQLRRFEVCSQADASEQAEVRPSYTGWHYSKWEDALGLKSRTFWFCCYQQNYEKSICLLSLTLVCCCSRGLIICEVRSRIKRKKKNLPTPQPPRPCKRITLFILNPRWQELSVRI